MAFSVVQSAVIPNVGYPFTVALPSPVTVGNDIIVIWSHSYTGCPPSLTDSLGNTYARAGQFLVSGVGGDIEAHSARVTTAGTPTLTFAAGCGQSDVWTGWVFEATGLAPTGVLFDGEVGAQTASSTQSSGALTTTDVDVLISYGRGSVVYAGGNAWTPTDGSTVFLSGTRESLMYLVTSAPGTYTATATTAGGSLATNPANLAVIAFKLQTAVLMDDDAGWLPQASPKDIGIVSYW
jgi:hypothetical protein